MPLLSVEVVFADHQQQKSIRLLVPTASQISTVIQLSGILLDFPNINLTTNKVGIFGRLSDLDAEVKEGDRIEIYQALRINPKKIRSNRAEKQKITK